MSDIGPLIRVLIVDDHPLYRQGLRLALSDQPGLDIVGEAATGAEALELFSSLIPDMVVLDIHLPDMTGLDLARLMLQQKPSTRLAILTMLRDEEVFNAALALGVLGYVLKESAAEEILDCIRAVMRREPFVSAKLSGYLLRRALQEPVKAGPTMLDILTTAERRVLKLLARSMTSKEIALELGVSPRTIEAHRANIGSKLGLKGSHSLLRFAISRQADLGQLK